MSSPRRRTTDRALAHVCRSPIVDAAGTSQRSFESRSRLPLRGGSGSTSLAGARATTGRRPEVFRRLSSRLVRGRAWFWLPLVLIAAVLIFLV